MSEPLTQIGIISDTHGLLRPEAMDALRGSQLILHIGDVGAREILTELETIAPVIAVRGNIDREDWCDMLPMTQEVSLGPHRVHMIHILAELAIDPAEQGISAVLCGHSHKPEIFYSEDVLYFNPGSAGPRRFQLPITVGSLRISDGALQPDIIEIVR